MRSKLLKQEKAWVIIIIAFILLSLSQGLLKSIADFEEIDLVDDFFLLVLFVLSVIFAFNKKITIKKKDLFIFVFPAAFFVYLFITGFINRTSILVTAVSFRDYFQYFLFFIFLVVFFNEEMFQKVHFAILLIGVIEVLVATGQIILTNVKGTFHPDLIGGTMGESGSHILSSVLIFFVGYYLSKLIVNRKIRVIEAIYFVSVIIVLVFISFRTLLILSPLIILLYLIIIGMYKKRIFIIIVASAIVFMVIVGLVIHFTGFYVINIKDVLAEQASPEVGSRFFQIKYIFSNILDSPLKILFGDGPGTFFSKTCRFFNYDRWVWVANNVVKGYMQYSITVTEIGFIGLLGMISYYVLIIRNLRKKIFPAVSSGGRIIVYSTIFYVICYIFAGIGGNIFEWQEANLLLWFYIAYSYQVDYLGNKV
jgi:hypothetical protein